ncbi:MAG TPA: hypothetical protein EYN79_03390 [Planctomycetes bacterium]|nr:hypothetical protein [Planctomycetota bacterium]
MMKRPFAAVAPGLEDGADVLVITDGGRVCRLREIVCGSGGEGGQKEQPSNAQQPVANHLPSHHPTRRAENSRVKKPPGW